VELGFETCGNATPIACDRDAPALAAPVPRPMTLIESL